MNLFNKILLTSFVLFFIIFVVVDLKGVSYGSDDGRIFQTAKLSIEDGPSYVLKTAMPIISNYFYSLFLSVYGYNFKLILLNSIIAMISLFLLLNILKKVGISQKIIMVPFVLLFSSPLFFYQLIDVRPYFLANLFILISINFFLDYLIQSKRKYLLFSAFFLACVFYVQNLFIIGSVIPGIYFLLSRFSSKKMKLLDILIYYSLFVLIISPWVIYRFPLGLSNFYRSPITWMHSEGYWSEINTYLFSRPTPRSIEYYKYFMIQSNNLFAPAALLFFLFPIFFVKIKRERLIIFIWAIVFIFPFLLGKVPTEIRYLFPLAFPIIILFGGGYQIIHRKILEKEKKIECIVLALIIIISLLSFTKTIESINLKNKQRLELIDEIESFKENISTENIYFRSHLIAPLFPQNRVYAITDFELKDAISFIGWESDKKVKEVLDKYGIKYIFLYKSLYWERDFHSWIHIATGGKPKHYIEIEKSNCFVKIRESKNFKMYELAC